MPTVDRAVDAGRLRGGAGGPAGSDGPAEEGTASRRVRVDVRLAVPAALAWPAAWWATGTAPVTAALVAGVLLGGGGALAVVAARRSPAARAARAAPWPDLLPSAGLALAVCAAVVGSAAAAAAVRSAGPLPQWAGGHAVVELTGRASGDARRVAPGPFGGGNRYAVRLHATSASARGATTTTSAPVLVLGDERWAGVTAGQVVTLSARLRPAEPGDDVVALGTAYGGPLRVEPATWPWRAADRIREGLRTASSGLGEDAGGLLPSLVVGDTSRLPEELREDMQTSGLTHLTAVSGANVAIVTGSVLWAATCTGLSRRGRWLLAGVALVGFVILARPQPSVLRAATMGAVVLVGLAVARRAQGIPVLAAAVVLLLVADPWLARSAGFALSTVATGSLLLLAPAWADRLERVMPRPVALALAAPAAAQAACGPIVVLLDPAVSTVAVPANLLADPAVAPATVLGVVAALLSVVWPWGAQAVASVAGVATGWIAIVAHRAADVPGAELPWWPGTGGALALLGLTAAVVALSLVRTRADPAARSRPSAVPRWRAGAGLPRVLAAALAAVLAGWLLGARVPLPGRGPGAAGEWTVAMCDVGQGDATALRSGEDRAVLIDVGPDPAAVDGCLRRLGIRHLDLVVLTHGHADHVLGLPGALRGRTAGRLLVSPMHEPRENADRVLRWAALASVPVEAGVAGATGRAGTGAHEITWTLLSPLPHPSPGPAAAAPRGATGVPSRAEPEGSEVNESSVTLVADVTSPRGSLRVVALGDLETAGQAALLRSQEQGATLDGVDVVKVAHHGSAKQVGALYRRIAAPVALVGVGAGNDYGHPAPSALTMLERAGATVLRTDRDGDIMLVPGRDRAVGVTTGGR